MDYEELEKKLFVRWIKITFQIISQIIPVLLSICVILFLIWHYWAFALTLLVMGAVFSLLLLLWEVFMWANGDIELEELAETIQLTIPFTIVGIISGIILYYFL